jgi:hypothetical protein
MFTFLFRGDALRESLANGKALSLNPHQGINIYPKGIFFKHEKAPAFQPEHIGDKCFTLSLYRVSLS